MMARTQAARTLLVVALTHTLPFAVEAAGPQRTAQAWPLGEASLHLDGILDEEAWCSASWVSGLTQKDPVEGEPGAELSEVAFCYDERNLYIGARLWTPLTGRLRTRLGPRDDMAQTQALFISLDTYHDRRTAWTFGTTAAGVRVDFLHPEDSEMNQVLSWDPVWDVRTTVHDDHWVVEARIPFTQLRFNPGEEQVWGLQIDRWTPERNAEDYWCMVPRSETGWASRFGELHGIRGIRPSRRLELLPYVAGELSLPHRPDPDDPFLDEHELDGRLGGDLKMGVGPNLTLDATFNPDFGQVEADPADINLTAFETFFEERRPFFIEGDRLLRGLGPRYFYSRRIGAPPRPQALPDTLTHVDLPTASRILGAAKLTGRLTGGTSVGALAAVTGVERAGIHNQASGGTGSLRLAPRTSSGVLRVQQDFPGRGAVAGLTLTGLHRDFEGDARLAARQPRQALSGGLDWDLRDEAGLHSLVGNVGFSRVEGDSAAMLALQRSPVHYLQRPDAGHVHLDPGRRALTGWTGALELKRIGGRHWRWSAGAAAESPGLELNDLGQLSSADDISTWGSLTWQENQGKGPFRRWSAWQNLEGEWNFGGLPTGAELRSGVWGQLTNYWSINLEAAHGRATYSDDKSRGGVVLGVPGWNSVNLNANSPDLQRPNAVSGGGSCTWGEDRRLAVDAWAFGRFRPLPTVEIRVNPSATRSWNPAQYIDTLIPTDTGLDNDLAIFSRLDYREARLSTRLRYTFSPRLRVEIYAEPFMASLRFNDPGRPAGARSQHIERYKAHGLLDPVSNGAWLINEEGGQLAVPQPDAEFISWRSTCVLRWDWSLGSSLHLVWQQDRVRFIPRDDPARTPDPLHALSIGGDNLIAVKITSWLPLG
jgi:hypothetical protein